MSSSVGPPSSLSMADKHNLRDQLSAQVDGLRRQVEELRQHVQHNGGNDPQNFMPQLNGGGFNSLQQFTNHQRANILNQLSPMGGASQDMRQGMPNGGDDIVERMVQRKQAELQDIMDQQRQLSSKLESLDRHRSQIMGDLQQGGNGRFPNNLQGNLPQNLPPHFSSSMNQMRGPGDMGFPSTMDFLDRNKGSSDLPPSLMNGNFGGGFPSNNSSAGAALGTLRGRFQDMEPNNDSSHMDKKRRFLNNGFGDGLKPGLGGFKNFQRISSSFLPSELMGTPKNNADSQSILSSSHQLLMSQREANMRRDMLFGGMNGGMNSMMAGFNRPKPLHDGKLPEKKRKIGKDFVPEVDTVVLGKGNIPKTNIGNLKLKGLVMESLDEYDNGERRKKIAVISRIIQHVTSNNYKTTGFTKFEDDCWWEMTERDARVKITALFRDCLHTKYRSSSSSKVKRRQELRKAKSLAATEEAKEKAAKEANEETSSSDKPQDDAKAEEKGSKDEADDETQKRKREYV